MSAYKITKDTRKFTLKNLSDFKSLLKKYHISYIVGNNSIIYPNGKINLNIDYDYLKQKTYFEHKSLNNNQKIPNNFLDKNKFYIMLLHTEKLMLDNNYFKLQFILMMEPFLVYIDNNIYQIDSGIFFINNTIIILFEIIDFKTGVPISKDNINSKNKNFNLININKYQFFDNSEILYNNDNSIISSIIFNNIISCFSEISSTTIKNYSYIYNTLILSNNIDNVQKYLCEFICIKNINGSIKDISTTTNYEYYPQESVSIITNYTKDNFDIAMYNGILLESIKLYIYLFQIVNKDIEFKKNKVIFNELVLENLFYCLSVPIETQNLLDFIKETTTFKNHKESLKLKISYLNMKNQNKKNINSTILNFLIYILSVFSSIPTLEVIEKVIEKKFSIDFKYSFSITLMIFILIGFIWVLIEFKNNQD